MQPPAAVTSTICAGPVVKPAVCSVLALGNIRSLISVPPALGCGQLRPLLHSTRGAAAAAACTNKTCVTLPPTAKPAQALQAQGSARQHSGRAIAIDGLQQRAG